VQHHQNGGGRNIVDFTQILRKNYGPKAVIVLESFSKLNAKGKKELLKRVGEMLQLGDYLEKDG
jgi:hypothetical protein